MSHAEGSGYPEPTTADKVHFWLFGARLHRTFDAWIEEQIRSKWFPVGRTARAVPVIVVCLIIALAGDGSNAYLLQVATLPALLLLIASFVFRDRWRRRELRRHRIRE